MALRELIPFSEAETHDAVSREVSLLVSEVSSPFPFRRVKALNSFLSLLNGFDAAQLVALDRTQHLPALSIPRALLATPLAWAAVPSVPHPSTSTSTSTATATSPPSSTPVPTDISESSLSLTVLEGLLLRSAGARVSLARWGGMAALVGLVTGREEAVRVRALAAVVAALPSCAETQEAFVAARGPFALVEPLRDPRCSPADAARLLQALALVLTLGGGGVEVVVAAAVGRNGGRVVDLVKQSKEILLTPEASQTILSLLDNK